MLRNPKLYEINTRNWIKQFGENATLADVPPAYFAELADRGIELIWLMGVWKTSDEVIEKCCFSPELTASYSKALPNWKKEDVIGSPYAVDDYVINPALGTETDLLKLKCELNKLGLKLILDFIPNHFSAATKYLNTHPDIFLQTDEESYKKDSFTFFKHNGNYFAHGRDPLFPAWTDTVQVNFFNQHARDFLYEKVLKIAELCEGIRCDMTMLPLNNVFNNTWIGVHSKNNSSKPEKEFWQEIIEKTKLKYPDFIFIGEAYWDLEWELQQLGFDFTYDKRLLERLLSNDIQGIFAHLGAEKSYQNKSVRFIENHDENRAVTSFGKARSMAAAVVMSTIPGMKLYHDGQFTGRRTKLPVQLQREPAERLSQTIKKFYDKLLQITLEPVFKSGEFELLSPLPSDENDLTYHGMLSWKWKLKNNLRVIVINYSEVTAQCRLKFKFDTDKETISLIDKLTDKKYIRYVEEIKTQGLFVELKSFNSHIFSIEL